MKRAITFVAGGLAMAGLALGMGSGRAEAHPLGNLTVNTSARIVVAAESVNVDYVLDLAELPTVQERPSIDGAASPDVYAAAKCAALAGGLHVRLDGEARSLAVSGATATLLPGQGGLSTLRVECALSGTGSTGSSTLAWSDDNFTDRLGWREVVALGDGTTLTTDVPSLSTSDFLRSYPAGALAPRVLEASIGVRAGGPVLDPTNPSSSTSSASSASSAAAPQRRGADGLTRFFNRLVGDRDLTLGLGLLAAGVAFLLGALHSLAPGHGKTLMAAMVASRRGTMRQVLAVGGTVALTHTLGVVVLGILITTSQVVAPDRVLPWLTLASGALLLGTGAWLLGRRLVRGASAGGHHHGAFGHDHHDHDHDHHGHDHDGHHGHDHDDHHGHDHHGHHSHDHHDHGRDERPLSGRSLALMGMAGGLVPTPSALVVLLGATALGRAWFGVVLVGIYGIGMAATLLAAGMLLVKVQGWLERQYAQARWLAVSVRLLPVATAVLLIVGGLSIAVRGAASI